MTWRPNNHNQRGAMLAFSAAGENAEAGCEWPGPDMHCPELPQPGDNFWKLSCLAKQFIKAGACHTKNCQVGLALSGRTYEEPQRPTPPPAGLCQCGKPSIPLWRVRMTKAQQFICEACFEKRKKERKRASDRKREQRQRREQKEKQRRRREQMEKKRAQLQRELEKVESQLSA